MSAGPSLGKLFNNNRFVVVFAMLIAVISWVTVAMTTSQRKPQTIQDVPVNLQKQAAALADIGLSFIGVEEFTAVVEVNGARTVVGQLTPEDFQLTVDISRVTEPNTYDLRVWAEQYTAGDYEIISITPSTIRVRLDQVDSKSIEVEDDIRGLSSALGYMTDTPRITPSSFVKVTGPKSELEKVDRVVAVVELNQALSEPHTEDVPVTLLDMAGNVIIPEERHLSLDYENVTVIIPVLRVKTLPLTVEFQNMPAGFPESELRKYMEQSASVITLAGPLSSLESYNQWRLGYINLRSLSIENNRFIFGVAMPSAQFKNTDNLQAVVIDFDSENWASASFNIQGDKIALVNHPPGYSVSLQSVALTGVTFVGDADVIENMTADDIVAEVNLGDKELTLGTQAYPVRVSVPNKGLVWPVEENNNLTVYINVSEA